MPILLTEDVATLSGMVSIEDAEPLLAWLLAHDRPVDMADCQHAHPAVLQLLFCAGARIAPLPASPALRAWLTGEAASVVAFFTTAPKGIPS